MLKGPAVGLCLLAVCIGCSDATYHADTAGPCERTSAAGYVRTMSSATGKTAWWHPDDADCIPLGLDAAACNDPSCAGAETDTLLAVLATWNDALDSAGTPVCLEHTGPADAERWLGHTPGAENQNIVAFTADPAQFAMRHPSAPNVIAITTTSLVVSDARIVGSDIEINDGPYVFRCGNQPVANQLDLYSVLLHEVGHLMGFDHTADRASVMFPTESLDAPARRTLSAADHAGVEESFGCY